MELEGDRNEKKQRNAFLNELQHMRRLESAHIVQVFGVVTSAPRKLILVMELMPGGDLFLCIRKKRQENQTIPEKVRLGNLRGPWVLPFPFRRQVSSLGWIAPIGLAVARLRRIRPTPSGRCVCLGCWGAGGGERASLYVSVLTRKSVGVGLAVLQYYL